MGSKSTEQQRPTDVKEQSNQPIIHPKSKSVRTPSSIVQEIPDFFLNCKAKQIDEILHVLGLIAKQIQLWFAVYRTGNTETYQT